MPNTIEGFLFNIQRYSLHDGPGIRTLVFMKGCPLRCAWCSNPESQSFHIDLSDRNALCSGCGRCAALCPQNAISPKTYTIDRALCDGCGICAKNCPTTAKSSIGTRVGLNDVLEQIEADRLFYANSNGGVTIGGGEPCAQPEFVAALLQSCRKNRLHTAIETCGFAAEEVFSRVISAADLIYFDIKLMDSDQHKRFTGEGNERILRNALKAGRDKNVIFRLPLIPGVNDDAENLHATAEFIAAIDRSLRLEIVPYHNLGEYKYKSLGRSYKLSGAKAYTAEGKKQLAEYVAALRLPVETSVLF